MLTKKDINLLKEIFVTKDYLEERFQVFEEKMESKLVQLKSDIFSKLDPILKELVASREEQSLLTHKVYDDHEPRIIS